MTNSLSVARRPGSSTSAATASWRAAAATGSPSGRTSQSRRRREPIGVTVWSSTRASRALALPRRVAEDLQVAHRGAIEHKVAAAPSPVESPHVTRQLSLGRPHVFDERAGGAHQRLRRLQVERAQRPDAQHLTQQSLAAGGLEPRRRSDSHHRVPDLAAREPVGRRSLGEEDLPRLQLGQKIAGLARRRARRSAQTAGRRLEERDGHLAADLPQRGDQRRSPSPSNSGSVTVPGVSTRITARRTSPPALAGSSTCSAIATFAPRRAACRRSPPPHGAGSRTSGS